MTNIEKQWVGRHVNIIAGYYHGLGYKKGVVQSAVIELIDKGSLSFWVKLLDEPLLASVTGKLDVNQMEIAT